MTTSIKHGADQIVNSVVGRVSAEISFPISHFGAVESLSVTSKTPRPKSCRQGRGSVA